METDGPCLPVAGTGRRRTSSRSPTTITLPPGIPLLDCSVHGTPIQQGRLSSSKTGHIYDTNQKRLRPWRQDVADVCLAERFLDQPWTGPVAVIVHFWFGRPRSHYRTGKHLHELRADAPAYHHTIPDNDKLLRSILDSMTVAQVFDDDKRVCWALPVKRYAAPGDPPGADIYAWGLQ